MQYYQPLLLTPGPTPVPNSIMSAIQLPMVGHRSKDFEDIADEAFKGLKPIFGTKNEVLILTSSGTSVLEASMLNIVNQMITSLLLSQVHLEIDLNKSLRHTIKMCTFTMLHGEKLLTLMISLNF